MTNKQVSFMSKCKNNCNSHSGVNVLKNSILIRISFLYGFNKTRKDRKINWLKSVCRTNVHPSKGASPCSPLNKGASPFLKGEWTYARAYSPFFRLNVERIDHVTSEHPSWRLNEGWTGWGTLKGERIRVNQGWFTLMKDERNKGESN